MPRRTTQLPADATTLARRVQDLERQMRELRASRRASYADIGGGTTVITGARIQTAADGRRVVLDDSGALQTYDDEDNLTNYMGGVNNVIWNQSGFPSGEYVGMIAGNLVLAVGNAQVNEDSGADLGNVGLIGVLGHGFGYIGQSPVSSTMSVPLFVEYLSGAPGGTTGTATMPQVQVTGDISVAGSVVKQTTTWDSTNLRYMNESWHTPTWSTGWATGGTLNGNATFRGLQYRLTAEDEVWVYGAAVASTGAGATITTLPTGYRPPTNKRCLIRAYFSSGSGTPVSGWAQVTEAGAVNVGASLSGWTVASGTQVFLDGRFPLGNLA